MVRLLPPIPTSDSVSAVMRGNRKTNTRPEVRLRSALHRLGCRFRKHLAIDLGNRRVRGDVVFSRHRIVVFVDGCFWHRCATHGNTPRSNKEYWEKKLARNTQRDRVVDGQLKKQGWKVLRVWEHETVDVAARRIHEALLTATSKLES